MKRIITLITCFTIGIAAEGKIGGVTYFDYANSEEKSAFNFQRQYFSYTGVASDKIEALMSAGALIANHPEEIPELLARKS